ncbi:MAG TPA: IPT/TIG domain-containing protein [Thermoanaerobaculia bacterium]|nr:IPT/TIG domain-containing protein [Thermoanaerobaculia bacterium]
MTDAGDTTGSCATTGTGTCTLRDAITYANAHPGTTIAFNISGAGVHTIMPGASAALPAIIATTTIDGYTQPGSQPNSNGPGLGDNSTHLIELDFENQPAFYFWGLEVDSGGSNSVIRGLVINRAPSGGIAILNADGVTVEGCFLGTDPTGSSSPGRQQDGVWVEQGSASAVIGGTTPDARNVISGALISGVAFGGNGNGGSNHVVEGNFIGTNAAGTGSVPNDFGISLSGTTTFDTVGGTTAGARNLISGNSGRGVLIGGSLGAQVVENNTVEGNWIGTDVTGALPLGNGEYGIECNDFNNTIGGSAGGAGNVIAFNAFGGIGTEGGCNGLVVKGNFIGTDASGTARMGNHGPAIGIYGSNGTTLGGINAGEANTIAFNGTGGVSGAIWVGASTAATIRGNSIHDNLATGIDLSASGGPDGVTANDLGDADSGGNNLQNFPIVSSVTYGANTTVDGFLNSTASTTFDLDFYSNPACSNFPREFLQGATYIGSAQVTTDGSGNATIHVTTLAGTPSGSRISITATDPAGNTSEFSQRLPFSVNTTSGDAGGGTALTIAGTNFLSGATVTIGGAAATGVNVSSYTSIAATTPALTPGSANDVVVTNTDSTSGTLVKGFVADFLDVPSSQQFHFYVTTLVSNAITAGIGGGLYGVNDNTLRQQMAVFILKGKHGLCYTPPPCVGMFGDVPCPSTFANWIEAMANEGITGGCGGGNFCPMNPVRRDQMAVFLLKAEHGSSYVPPTCTGIFPDVPCPSTFANWIEQLAAEMITGGCGGGNYCPLNPNTRGQMAVFITKTFNLQ